MQKSPKVLFAAGGTGGHLFPAQALAEQLQQENRALDLLFAGAQLSGSPYFDREKFRFHDVTSTTPFRGGLLKKFFSVGVLIKGIWESLRLLAREKPDLVVGFGSFHAFPVLCAAVLKKIPLVLFESNAVAGKVIRFFSKKADFTGIYFSQAKQDLKGKTYDVDIPVRNLPFFSKEEARARLKLDPHLLTILVFGGSQGAQKINQTVFDLLPRLHQKNLSFQLIHLTGDEGKVGEIVQQCKCFGIPCYVKKFESQMGVCWSAADLVICRAGAMTLSELLHYEIPGILIPYPFASEQHQLKNASVLEKAAGGALLIEERFLNADRLDFAVLEVIRQATDMKLAINTYKTQQKKQRLNILINNLLKKGDIR